MKNILFFIISIFFSVQVLAQTGDSQEVVPTDQTAKTNLAGEYIYADSYFKKSKTGVNCEIWYACSRYYDILRVALRCL